MKGIDFMNEPKSFIQEVTEYISVKRKERLENAVFGEIKEMVKDNEHFTTIELNEKAIVEALEKQIPKRPILKKSVKVNGFMLRCPNADCEAVLQSDSPYCKYCGQALDWSDHPTEKGGD